MVASIIATAAMAAVASSMRLSSSCSPAVRRGRSSSAACHAGRRRRTLSIVAARGSSASAGGQEAKPRVMFSLGGPGAGKGTQCERLEAEYGMVHLSAGELLRAERGSGSKDGELIESYLREGKIVPVAISLGLLKREMETRDTSRFVIDGFPRNQDNLDGWNQIMADFADVDCVLFYDVPDDELVRRMLSRGETSGRSDDNQKAARKRLDTFHESTMPLIHFFESSGSLRVVRIPGDRSVDDVWELTKTAVSPYLAHDGD